MLAGLTSAAIVVSGGIRLCISSRHFAINSTSMVVMPVTLPPGRARLATRPTLTGSVPIKKTIGIVWVAALAASAPGVLPTTAITATSRRTKSIASAGSRSLCPPPIGIRSLRCGPRQILRRLSLGETQRQARASSSADAPLRNPITGIAGCCACATIGHVAAAPPRSVMNSRRLIRSTCRRGQAASAARSGRAPSRF